MEKHTKLANEGWAGRDFCSHKSSYRGGAHLKMGKEKVGMNEFGGKKWALTALFA